MKASHLGMLLVAPSVIVIFSICVYPLIYAVYLSFNKIFSFGSPEFVGLSNYSYLVSNPDYWNAFENGLIWTFGTVSLQVLYGLATALILNEPFKGRSIARACILMPYVIPTVSSVIIFRMSILDPTWGFVDQVIGTPIPWLGSPGLAMISVILVGTWVFYPFVTLATLARLQTIPQALYEAAKVDGAGKFSRFRHVTLPALADILMVTILLRIIFMYTKFDVPWFLTGGGPQSSTQTLPLLTYKVAIQMRNRGLGSAIGVTLFIALILMVVVYFRVYKTREA